MILHRLCVLLYSLLAVVLVTRARAHFSCITGAPDLFTQRLGANGILKFPIANSYYEAATSTQDVDMHFYSPDKYKEDYLTCPGMEDDSQQDKTSGCAYCAPAKVYSCYGPELTSVVLPYNYQRTPLLVYRLNFVSVDTLTSFGFLGLDTRHISIQFGGIRYIEPNAFNGIINLNTLLMVRNDIADLGRMREVFAGLNNLTALVLDHNMIRTWDSREDENENETSKPLLDSLELLSLGGNPLDRLTNSSFLWLQDSPLKYLNLRECTLNIVSPDILTPVKNSLEFLDLGSARINGRSLKNLLWSLSPDPGQASRLIGLGMSYLGLTAIPAEEIEPVRDKLQYLSLYGNNFDILSSDEMQPLYRDRRAYLPPLPNLLELDLQACQLKTITAGAFDHMPNLRTLLLDRNALSHFEPSSFRHLSALRHLGLSRNAADPFSPPLFGQIYAPESLHFEDLPSLAHLDFSHSPITHLRADSFHGLGANLQNLSLCGVGVESIEPAAFRNLTGLAYLELTANVNLATVFSADIFLGLGNLQELHMPDCGFDFKLQVYSGTQVDYNSPTDDPFQHFTHLRILNLTDNNIKYLSDIAFQSLAEVEVIALGYNRILSWTTPVFASNHNLKHLDLSRNRISFMTETMLREFARLDTLDMSENPFLCDCYIPPFLRLASNYNDTEDAYEDGAQEVGAVHATDGTRMYPTEAEAAKRQEATNGIVHDSIAYDMTSFIQGSLYYGDELSQVLNVEQQAVLREMMAIDVSDLDNHTVYVTRLEDAAAYTCLDTRDSTYVAFTALNDSLCEKDDLEWEEEEEDKMYMYYPYKPAITIVVTFLVAVLIGIVLFFIYRQRWKIRYFALQLKNATVMSFLGRTTPEICDEIYTYDVFVSYSDVDRGWVLDELLPNLEKHGDLKVCLHERDFQVGMSILENIIANMDHSRSILLIVSRSFVKSRWCQFELHLAQHRLLETRRERLALVLLEDIPRSRRPGVLHYLMLTKTYIVWPTQKGRQEAFWGRLRRAVTPLGLSTVSVA